MGVSKSVGRASAPWTLAPILPPWEDFKRLKWSRYSGFSCSLFSPFSALSLAAIAPFCAPLNHFYQLLRLDCVFKFICTFQLWPNPFEIERFHQNLLPLGLHQVEQQRSEIGFETQTLGIFLVFKHNSFGVETNHHINILPFQFTLIVSLYFWRKGSISGLSWIKNVILHWVITTKV